MRYKTGDSVIIRSDYTNVNEAKTQLAGLIVPIDSVGHVRYSIAGWIFSDDDIDHEATAKIVTKPFPKKDLLAIMDDNLNLCYDIHKKGMPIEYRHYILKAMEEYANLKQTKK
jgi:hypothetical protein